jgi:hypothetical protein
VSSTCSCRSWLDRPNIGYWLEIPCGQNKRNQGYATSITTGLIFLAALATGALIVNWIELGRAMSRLSVSTYVEFHQATNHTFDPYKPIVIVGALGNLCKSGLPIVYDVHWGS